jgi:acetylornithine deacetylase
VEQELARLLDDLRARDPDFAGSSRRLFSRPSYEIDASHPLPQTLRRAAARAGNGAPLTSMTFWTDAAVLAAAGTPSVLFGPGGAGLHSVEEYVRIADVLACRDTLVTLVRDWSSQARQGS